MATENLQWQLASRPRGAASPDNFRLVTAPLAVLRDGQVRVRNRYLSIDPYMRPRMDERRSYTDPQPLNEVMQGGAVGEVVESRSADFKPGDPVLGRLGWQLYATVAARELTCIEQRADVPLSTRLGCTGMPGITAWYGLKHIIQPRAGETVVVGAASGAVGSVVGQLARQFGARTIGIAGGAEKCAIVKNEFGFDACLDHKNPHFAESLAQATPEFIDGDFENVGGPILNAILPRMNAHGRIALCGLIAAYDARPAPLQNFVWALLNRLRIQAFVITEHPHIWPAAGNELADLVASGKLHYRESIVEGLENAPKALLGLLAGTNVGKQLVKLI